MKKTALTHIHEALGAKMVPFAGYSMPVQYEGVNIEHHTVRNGVGVFDVSHMGEFFVEGEDALDLVQSLTSNDAARLQVGKAQYSCITNDNGGIIDDLIVYRTAENTYMLVVNAANIEKDWNWITSKNTFKNVTLTNRSDEYSLLAIQGPKAVEAMQSLTKHYLFEIKFYNFIIGEFAGVSDVIISATGYTGSGGFEIYMKNEDAETIWNKVMEAGKDFGIKPIGLAARDTLRLEMGYSLYGNDIDDSTSPFEAGLGWIVKFTKSFTNSDNLSEQKKKILNRKLVAFEMVDRGIPRSKYDIVDEDGTLIGKVTSGTMSPSLKKGIGLGYVNPKYSEVGSSFFIQIRKKRLPATVVKLPFYKGKNS
jgi:aminomethyltransferase